MEEQKDWTPLLMVIAAAWLAGTSYSLMVYGWGGQFGSDSVAKLGILVSMLTIVSLVVSVLFVVYGNVNKAKPVFLLGVVLLIIGINAEGVRPDNRLGSSSGGPELTKAKDEIPRQPIL